MTKPDYIREGCKRCNGEEWIMSPGEAVEVRCPDCLRGYAIEFDFSTAKSAKKEPEFQRIAERDRERALQVEQELENNIDKYLAHHEKAKRQQRQIQEKLGKLD